MNQLVPGSIESDADFKGGARFNPQFALSGEFWGSVGGDLNTLVDAATIAIDADLGGGYLFTAANGTQATVRAFQVPTGGVPNQVIPIYLLNSSGGALSATSFAAAIKQPAAITYPATGKARIYYLQCISAPVAATSTPGTWALVLLSAADLA